MPELNAYLKLSALDERIPITVTQARKLIDATYGGSLETAMQNDLNNLKVVDVMLSHPMAGSYGKVYLEVKR